MDLKHFFRSAFDHAYGKKVDEVDLPDAVAFTYPAHGNSPQPGTRRERRAVRPRASVSLNTDAGYPIEYLLNARARRRHDEQARARRQRKGNRAFQRAQMARRYSDDTKRAQLAVLNDPTSPMYDNVAHDLRVKYADELRAQGAL